ncbi:Planctomycete cytochrome C [Singulisphaera sp. GP187]|uniref:PSD1 and planctomycete cytochrome C domain-containing protein n=1 Tax=Singulisphaera sp. GP187 TaxID=1882752 RepID=UPI000927DF71|nr:PSD1 and planctomycete cytochrome C domain-containing protein [Singulisphaera sp. GP187]SIO22966.1 Planctomycete cytochrome C [Singulisphaera sp. GP187]
MSRRIGAENSGHTRNRAVAAALLWPLLLGMGAAPGASAQAKRRPIEFNREIRSILSENCFACHGPDKSHRKADLRLDLREAALEKEAFVPGKPEESEVISRVFSTAPDEVMPPPQSHKTLTTAQKDLLRRWVEDGAEYQPHWAYVIPQRPEVPAVKQAGSVRGPIDAFILRTLESKGINPSLEADRRTLLRRLSLDLTGLPPTPAEVQAYVSDDDPKAYERQVDRLLDSPHYGERMAVPWLDLVRFTDTVGYHGDQNQRIFPYRDYVVDAFNRNLPFDQFTVEQLAGDLLPSPTPRQLVATGFNRLNMMTREGGAQPNEYLAKYAADRVRTVAITWLGSTLGCAECHDHKFDPFTTKDFYSLSAFFADVKQWGVYSDYGYTPNPELKGWTNDYPFPPEIEVESSYLVRRRERLEQRIEQVVTRSAEKLASTADAQQAFEAWRNASLQFLAKWPATWAVAPAIADDSDEAVAQADGSFLLSGSAKEKAKTNKKVKDDFGFRLKPGPGWLASIRLEVLPHASYGGSIVRGGAETTTIQLTAKVKSAKTGKETGLTFAYADADHKDERYANGAALLGVKAAWKTSTRDRKSPQTSVWRLTQPIRLAEGDELIVTVKSDGAGCVRLAVSPFGYDDPRERRLGTLLAAALRTAPEARTSEQSSLLQAAYLDGTGWDSAALAEVNGLRQDVEECRGGRAFSMITEAQKPRPMRVLGRGNWQDESGAIVVPSVPGFLPQPANPEGRRLTRLDLARWLTAPENPLTARVFVNRLWKQFFGIGISSVMEDVGAQGEWPVHPELLDWLAVEFRESGWDVKHVVKLMVMSATYQQDSRLRPDLAEIDPDNRLLAWHSPRRLEAEFVRDNALAVAGLLNLEIGGPSAHPYQPEGYYANLQFPDRVYRADDDLRQYRRGVYTHWQRTFMHPMLANFDAPSREECTASRPLANTPQQALTLLNDPTFVEAARVLAVSLVTAKEESDDQRMDRLFRKVLARPARAGETRSLLTFLNSQRSLYASRPDDAKKLLHVGLAPVPPGLNEREAAAWTSVCRVVLNLNETITRY